MARTRVDPFKYPDADSIENPSKDAIENSARDPFSDTKPGQVPASAMPPGKRALDIVVALVGLLVTAPAWLFIGPVSAALFGRPVLYRQARGGLGGRTFNIVKFRTMTDARDETGVLLSDDERRNWWGDLLRRTSLDEIPTLFNILFGDMSLVGPRPLMAKYLGRYDQHQAQRHRVTPGLTGLAQTKGRNRLTWEEKFELDLEYVRTRSMTTDLGILRDTISIVLSGDGADGNDHTTEFTGRSRPPSALGL